MATPQVVEITAATSLVTNYLSTASLTYTLATLPYTISTLGRVLYLKEASEIPGPSVFGLSTLSSTSILGSTLLYLNSNEALTIQCFSTNTWGILGGYRGTSVFSTQQLPVNSVIVNPSMNSSQLFVDLRTQSKTVVLPPIQTITSISSASPFFSIKDVYGFASTSTLYISCSATNTLERSSINNALRINQNFASIDLVANAVQRKWHILNYYDGTLVSRR
jgi:hypothetical protein